jgi:hypothetical protein
MELHENLMEMGKSHKEAADQVRDEKRRQECLDLWVCLLAGLRTSMVEQNLGE